MTAAHETSLTEGFGDGPHLSRRKLLFTALGLTAGAATAATTRKLWWPFSNRTPVDKPDAIPGRADGGGGGVEMSSPAVVLDEVYPQVANGTRRRQVAADLLGVSEESFMQLSCANGSPTAPRGCYNDVDYKIESYSTIWFSDNGSRALVVGIGPRSYKGVDKLDLVEAALKQNSPNNVYNTENYVQLWEGESGGVHTAGYLDRHSGIATVYGTDTVVEVSLLPVVPSDKMATGFYFDKNPWQGNAVDAPTVQLAELFR